MSHYNPRVACKHSLNTVSVPVYLMRPILGPCAARCEVRASPCLPHHPGDT